MLILTLLPSDLIVRIVVELAAADISCVHRVSHFFRCGMQSLVEQALRLSAGQTVAKQVDAEALLSSEAIIQVLLWQRQMQEEDQRQFVAAGHYHSIFLCDDGLKTCGVEWNGGPCPGLLGQGETIERRRDENGYERRYLSIPQGVTTLQSVPIKSVVAGAFHTLALSKVGNVYSWGDGKDGKLGHGEQQNQCIPRRIARLRCVRCVSAGHSHSLAACSAGIAWIWGCVRYPSTEVAEHWPAPQQIEALADVCIRYVAAGGGHSLAVDESGGTWSWGCGGEGQLGHGNKLDQFVPKLVTAFAKVRVCRVASRACHNLAVDDFGAVWSWGHGAEGRLGHGDEQDQAIPQPIDALRNVRIHCVAAGDYHSLAIDKEGAIWSWGYAAGGALGHGDKVDQPFPKRIAAVKGVRFHSLAAGEEHSLAVSNDGNFYGWGVVGPSGARLGMKNTKNQMAPQRYEGMTGP